MDSIGRTHDRGLSRTMFSLGCLTGRQSRPLPTGCVSMTLFHGVTEGPSAQRTVQKTGRWRMGRCTERPAHLPDGRGKQTTTLIFLSSVLGLEGCYSNRRPLPLLSCPGPKAHGVLSLSLARCVHTRENTTSMLERGEGTEHWEEHRGKSPTHGSGNGFTCNAVSALPGSRTSCKTSP